MLQSLQPETLRKVDLFYFIKNTKIEILLMPRRSGFTHFGSIPFITESQKEEIKLIQD